MTTLATAVLLLSPLALAFGEDPTAHYNLTYDCRVDASGPLAETHSVWTDPMVAPGQRIWWSYNYSWHDADGSWRNGTSENDTATTISDSSSNTKVVEYILPFPFHSVSMGWLNVTIQFNIGELGQGSAFLGIASVDCMANPTGQGAVVGPFRN